ncbi:MAG: hypothetical protein FWD82_00490 [Defluviitaleaceae bacterium]|nr:hypothetical protein [Defluviitaleaceae bacterium]
MEKWAFEKTFVALSEKIQTEIVDASNKWAIKGFIDIKKIFIRYPKTPK